MLYISKITADEGPRLKRYRAASMGRANPIIKRMSHILVELDVLPEKVKEIEENKVKKDKKIFGKKIAVNKKVKNKTLQAVA